MNAKTIFLVVGGLVAYEVIKSQGRNQLNAALDNLDYQYKRSEVVASHNILGVRLPKTVRLHFQLTNNNTNVSGRITYYKGEIIYAKRYRLGMVMLTDALEIAAGETVPYSIEITLDYAQLAGEIARIATEGFRLGSLVVKGHLGVTVGNKNLQLPYDYPIQILTDA